MLDFFFTKIEREINLKDHTLKALHRLNIYNIRDLLFYNPIKYISKNINPNLSLVFDKEHIITDLTIDYVEYQSRYKKNSKIYAYNDTGEVELIFFSKIPEFIKNFIKSGSKIKVEGKISKFLGKNTITHPEFILNKDYHQIEPIYPLTYAITNKQLHSYIVAIINKLKQIPEWLNYFDINSNISFYEALKNIHIPKGLNNSSSIKRLAFDELISNQLYLNSIRRSTSKNKDIKINIDINSKNEILQKLGFTLTSFQEEVIKDIEKDFISNKRMIRMLQGDVGSGKTLVALLTMISIITSGYQVAIMAPTDILANQHFDFFSKALENSDIKLDLLTGSIKKSSKKEIYEKLKEGNLQLIIGTHAIFQDGVEFNNLGYIVIDEQHRFGVEQRMQLINKSVNAEILVMTATPIPRSLTLTLFGDMPVSRLAGKPKGRIPITTTVMSKNKIEDLIYSLKKKIDNKEKIYWVCTLIEKDEENQEKQNGTDVMTRYEIIKKIYPGKVGIIHGKLKPKDKDMIMNEFKYGDIDIIVSTTVIEVGIDVKDATLIIIEDAEMFGLAQLHQLRGRVGRGDKESYCILLYGNMLGKISKKRLEVMKKSSDGFYIAEEDLILRGGGDITGVRQSGMQHFFFSSLPENQHELISAHDIINKYIDKIDTENKDIKLLIKLFNNDKDHYIVSG